MREVSGHLWPKLIQGCVRYANGDARASSVGLLGAFVTLGVEIASRCAIGMHDWLSFLLAQVIMDNSSRVVTTGLAMQPATLITLLPSLAPCAIIGAGNSLEPDARDDTHRAPPSGSLDSVTLMVMVCLGRGAVRVLTPVPIAKVGGTPPLIMGLRGSDGGINAEVQRKVATTLLSTAINTKPLQKLITRSNSIICSYRILPVLPVLSITRSNRMPPLINLVSRGSLATQVGYVGQVGYAIREHSSEAERRTLGVEIAWRSAICMHECLAIACVTGHHRFRATGHHGRLKSYDHQLTLEGCRRY